MENRITLNKSWFTANEEVLVDNGDGLSASIFAYSTGIQAVRLKNRRGEAVILPYQGQQVWDATFDGRSLCMFNRFEEPRPAASIIETYGVFMYHCGALRMGTPSPEDNHAVHGELPCAKYNSAAVVIGQDAEGPYIGVTGAYNYRMGFGDFYNAVPRVVLRRDKAVMDISMNVENVGGYPMDLMYMAHINFLIGDDARISQTSGWSVEDMILRTSFPAHVKPNPEFLAFMDKLKADPKATEVLRKSDVYNPEIVFFLRNVKAGKDGMAHFLQTHTDGTADYVSYDPAKLSKHVRWILKNNDQRVIGILPAICEPEGYAAEKKKGFVASLGAGQSVTFQMKAGLLSKTEAAQVAKNM